MGHKVNRHIGKHRLRIVVVATSVWLAADALAQDATTLTLMTDVSSTRDSDGFRSTVLRTGALPNYENPWRYSGVVAQTTRYARAGFGKDVAAVQGIYRDQRKDTLAGISVEAGVARVSGHLRAIGDLNLRMSTTLGSSVDMIVSSGLVETPKALDRAIGHTFVAAATEHQFSDRVTITALAGGRHFSDGNSRTHWRARLIWLAMPEVGMTLQIRHRQFRSRKADMGGAYFNPRDYQQWLGVAAIRKRHAGWIYSGAIGAGQENSTGTGARPSYLAELRAEGPLSALARITLHANYSRSAGDVDDPDYASRGLGAAITFMF